MIVANYGGGTNSTALLVEAHKRGLRPDLIVFADTGSERPITYTYLATVNAWLKQVGFPGLTIVRWVRSQAPHAGEFIALHDWCESESSLPSKAFGYSGCTAKWKQQPIERFLKNHAACKLEWLAGNQVTRWIGYDADEPERYERMGEKNPDPHMWDWQAPLIQWGMGREECVAAITAAGLPQPGKSSCWMCPSMTPKEIRQLGSDHPELLARALRMEAEAVRAGNIGVGGVRRGLGGRLNWGEMLAGKRDVAPSEDVACGCYDGD